MSINSNNSSSNGRLTYDQFATLDWQTKISVLAKFMLENADIDSMDREIIANLLTDKVSTRNQRNKAEAFFGSCEITIFPLLDEEDVGNDPNLDGDETPSNKTGTVNNGPREEKTTNVELQEDGRISMEESGIVDIPPLVDADEGGDEDEDEDAEAASEGSTEPSDGDETDRFDDGGSLEAPNDGHQDSDEIESDEEHSLEVVAVEEDDEEENTSGNNEQNLANIESTILVRQITTAIRSYKAFFNTIPQEEREFEQLGQATTLQYTNDSFRQIMTIKNLLDEMQGIVGNMNDPERLLMPKHQVQFGHIRDQHTLLTWLTVKFHFIDHEDFMLIFPTATAGNRSSVVDVAPVSIDWLGALNIDRSESHRIVKTWRLMRLVSGKKYLEEYMNRFSQKDLVSWTDATAAAVHCKYRRDSSEAAVSMDEEAKKQLETILDQSLRACEENVKTVEIFSRSLFLTMGNLLKEYTDEAPDVDALYATTVPPILHTPAISSRVAGANRIQEESILGSRASSRLLFDEEQEDQDDSGAAGSEEDSTEDGANTEA